MKKYGNVWWKDVTSLPKWKKLGFYDFGETITSTDDAILCIKKLPGISGRELTITFTDTDPENGEYLGKLDYTFEVKITLPERKLKVGDVVTMLFLRS